MNEHKKIEICLGQNCKPYGGQDLADELKKRGIPFTTFDCRSLCTYAPVVFVEDKAKLKASLDDVLQVGESFLAGSSIKSSCGLQTQGKK